MIRIDFTDEADKYAGSVYTAEGGWTEESLNAHLRKCAELWRCSGHAGLPFADYLVLRGEFLPKTSTVFHFQIPG